MKEAMFYHNGDGCTLSCDLCSHHCRVKDGSRGICAVRENRSGKMYSLVYGKLISEGVDPIEKKPLFHLLPGSRSYSIATVGCNFSCLHCQNFEISQHPKNHGGEIPGRHRSPEEVVNGAVSSCSRSLSYTYVEPTIFYEFAYDCARLAHERRVKNVFVSNGYMTPEVTRHLAPVLDGINIDLKAFTEEFYKKVCKARLAPVLETISLMRELGVWVEITTLIIPGWNDSDAELRKIAAFIKGVDPAMPWHVTAFYPTYRMTDRKSTSISTLRRARKIGLAEGLRFVYEGNIPGEGGENTYCPTCGASLIKRVGFRLLANRLEDGCCTDCREVLEGVWS